MLALLEYCVREKGGTYAMEDTDSMAIVSTEDGVACNGMKVTALSWEQVREISGRFLGVSQARYTSPMPPAPRKDTTS
jgi:hypothetical protein